MPDGMILKGIGGFYYVMTENGLIECRARGLFRKDKHIPLPGDRVKISLTKEDEQVGYVEEILPRINRIERPAVANADKVIIVTSATSPMPDLLLIDKLLLAFRMKKIEAHIFINKIDLDSEKTYLSYMEEYSKAGYNILSGCTLGGEIPNNLRNLFKSGITVLAGQSGVGKSTILNAVFRDLIMETGVVSEKIGRGKHTTRHAELIPLKDGGFIVDTPGFSSFEISEINENEIVNSYDEFDGYIENCRFKGCNHVNEPNCAVKNAVEEGYINKNRYLRYVQLYNAAKLESSRKYSKK